MYDQEHIDEYERINSELNEDTSSEEPEVVETLNDPETEEVETPAEPETTDEPETEESEESEVSEVPEESKTEFTEPESLEVPEEIEETVEPEVPEESDVEPETEPKQPHMYICVDDFGRITGFNPNDMSGNTGWYEIQGSISEPIFEEHGVPIYKYVEGTVVSCDEEEIEADIPEPVQPEVSEIERLRQLVSDQQTQLDEQADALIELAGMITGGEE